MDAKQPYASPPKLPQRRRGGVPQTRFEKETAANGGRDDTHNDPAILGPWVLGDTIGKGSSGRVRLARHITNGKEAAVKIIPKNIMFSTSRLSISNAFAKHEKLMLGIRREIVIMKLIDHPNIMSLYDVFEGENELYLLLEYIEGGELFDFLVSRGRLQPAEALKYFREVICGVDYCHRFNICHRDLKPENLLLDSDQRIKIADFGMAAMEIQNHMLETSCGSPHYASPEIVAGKAYHGAASDIWSCGVVLYALLVGSLPFDDPNMRVLLQKVRAGKFEIPTYIPAVARDLIRRMLVVDPEARIRMSEIMMHPFFTHPSVPRSINGPEPPSLEEIARAVQCDKSGDVDGMYLRSLAILFHGSPEAEIKKQLTCSEVTWHKAYYFLLTKYHQKTMEEYDMGYSFGFSNGQFQPPPNLIKAQVDKEKDISRRQRTLEREAIALWGTSAVSSSRDRVRQVEPNAGATNTSNHRRHAHYGGTGVHASRVPPFAAASPDKSSFPPTIVATRDAPTAPSPIKRSGTPGNSHPRPRPSSLVAGPRPPSSSGRVTPGIASAEDRDRQLMPPPPSPRRRRTGTEPSPRSTPNSVPPGGSAQHAIETANAEVVHARFGFGHPDRAEAFSATPPITAKSKSRDSDRSSARDGDSGPPRISFPSVIPQGLGLSFPGITPPMQNQTPTSPRSRVGAPHTGIQALNPPTVTDPALQRFLNDVAVTLNRLPSPAHSTPSTPGIQSPMARMFPHGGILDGTPARYSSSHESSTTDGESEDLNTTTPVKRLPPPTLGRRASNKENERGSGTGKSMDEYVIIKEQDVPTMSLAGRKHRPAPLELTNTNRISTGPQMSPIPSPLLVPSSDNSKGHGWFSSLFNLKPASYTLFSALNVASTRMECSRVLESFGVSVALEEGSDGFIVLKCHADKIHDVHGGFHSKSVRFRVQFNARSSSSKSPLSIPGTPNVSAASYTPMQSPMLSPLMSGGSSAGCTITLVQERGARSTLEAVSQSLQHKWNVAASSGQSSPRVSGNTDIAF